MTVRMQCRRFTRLTNAFSKKLSNLRVALALHFAWYNLVKMHKSIRMTPAMAAGVTRRPWSVAELSGSSTSCVGAPGGWVGRDATADGLLLQGRNRPQQPEPRPPARPAAAAHPRAWAKAVARANQGSRVRLSPFNLRLSGRLPTQGTEAPTLTAGA